MLEVEQMAQTELVIFFHEVSNIYGMRTETDQHFGKALNMVPWKRAGWKEQKEKHWLKAKIILVQEILISWQALVPFRTKLFVYVFLSAGEKGNWGGATFRTFWLASELKMSLGAQDH